MKKIASDMMTSRRVSASGMHLPRYVYSPKKGTENHVVLDFEMMSQAKLMKEMVFFRITSRAPDFWDEPASACPGNNCGSQVGQLTKMWGFTERNMLEVASG